MKKIMITALSVVAVMVAVVAAQRQSGEVGSVTPASKAELDKRMEKRERAETLGRVSGEKLAKEQIAFGGSHSLGKAYTDRLEAESARQPAEDRYPFKDGFRSGYDAAWKAESAQRRAKPGSEEWKTAFARGVEMGRKLATEVRAGGAGIPEHKHIVTIARKHTDSAAEEIRDPLRDGFVEGYTGLFRKRAFQ